MGIIYIGDRSVGKTHLALELANPTHQWVKVQEPGYDYLQAILMDSYSNTTKATDANREVDKRFLSIQASLPSGLKSLSLDWIDTPGEIWRTVWQAENPTKWNQFLTTIRESEGILLVLPPWRELVPPEISSEYFPHFSWCKRFERWVDFFQQDCPKAKHIVICLNKADLFCDLQQESERLKFDPSHNPMTWQQRHSWVSQRYFADVRSQLEAMSRSTTGLAVRCFITSIKNRSLLELPWIYLASFLARS
jgi:GTPase SAR1 family protein